MNKGDYVRTKNGLIDKIKYMDNDNNIFLENYNKENNIFGANSIIIKSSPNIIDLIEVGDYVNGYKVNVIQILKDETALICNDYNLDDSAVLLTNKDIKTIVTREQMSSMEYKVESEVK